MKRDNRPIEEKAVVGQFLIRRLKGRLQGGCITAVDGDRVKLVWVTPAMYRDLRFRNDMIVGEYGNWAPISSLKGWNIYESELVDSYMLTPYEKAQLGVGRVDPQQVMSVPGYFSKKK